jgi:autotransporter-associated beta strand protein
MKTIPVPRTAIATALVAASLSIPILDAAGADIFKANNVTALNLGPSWVTNSPPTQNIPGASDIAVWSSTTGAPSAANCRNGILGASASWGGIRVESPAGIVVITNSPGNQLTLGASGVSLTGTKDLTLGCALVLGASQTWGSLDRTFTVTNAISGAWGNDLTIANTATTSTAGTRLAAANTFAGSVFHNAGLFALDNSGALNGCTNVVVNSVDAIARGGSFNAGTVIYVGNNVSIPSTVSLSLTNNGPAPAISSTLCGVSGTGTWNGPINLVGSGGTVAFNTAGAVMSLPGNISGSPSSIHFRGGGSWTISGTLNIGSGELRKRDAAGTLFINSSGNTWGVTTLLLGKIVLGANNALPTSTVISNETQTASSTIDLAGFNQAIAGLSQNPGGSAIIVSNSSASADSTLTINGPGTFPFSGLIINGGPRKIALTINGGTTTLTGANTYSGNTLVAGGKLVVSTSQTGAGAFTVNDGATLGVTVASGGGTLNASSLTLGSAAGATTEVTLSGPPAAPVINTTTLATHGTVTVNILGGGLTLGQFTVIKYSGSIGGDGFGAFALGSLPTGIEAQLVDNTANQSVDLNVTAAPGLVWTGQNSAAWDIAQTVNWTNTGAGLPSGYTNGLGVQFDDSAIGPTIINLTTNVSPGGVLVSNTSLTYVFTNVLVDLGGAIQGSGQFKKAGAGTLIECITNNSYSGDTTVSAGTLQLGVSGVIPQGAGKGNFILNGTFEMAGFSEALNGLSGTGVVQNTVGGASTVTVGNNNASGTFSGILTNSTGTVALSKTGSGALTLTGANSHSGGTTISGGSLFMGHDQALGTGLLTISGGTLASDSSTPRSITNDVLITAACTLGGNNATLTFPGNINLNAVQEDLTLNSDVVWTGVVGNGAVAKFANGTLRIQSGASVTYGTDSAIKNGTVIIDGATLLQSSGAFRINSSVPSGLSKLILTNGATLTSYSGALRVGYSNGDNTATNIVEIWATADLQGSSGDSAKVLIGAASLRAIVNLRTNGLIRTRAVEHSANISEFNFDGGTLTPNSGPVAGTFMQGLSLARVLAGGAIIDTAGASSAIQIGQSLLDGGGGGGLVKLGTGKLSLNGTNTYTGSTVVSNGALGGIGVISGPVLVTDGAELSPGGATSGIGTLTVSNTITLAPTATCTIELKRTVTPNSDTLAANSIVAGGTLNIVNIGATLVGGDTFTIFRGPLSGSFAVTNLPALGTGMHWDTTQLGINGTIQVVTLQFTTTSVSGNSLTMSGSGGTPNGSYQVRTSTDVTLPIASWDLLDTRAFDSSGNFSFSVTIDTGTPKRFYRIQMP